MSDAHAAKKSKTTSTGPPLYRELELAQLTVDTKLQGSNETRFATVKYKDERMVFQIVLPVLGESGHCTQMSIRGHRAEWNAALPRRGQVLKAHSECVAALGAGRLDRCIGDRLAARMSVGDLCRSVLRKGSDGPRHPANLARAQLAVLLFNGTIDQDRKRVKCRQRERLKFSPY